MRQRLISVMFAAVVSATALFSFHTQAAVTLAGDLNCDGRVTVEDAVMSARLICEDPALLITPQGIENADCDADGLLCLLDVRSALRKASQITPELPAETTTVTICTTTAAATTTAKLPDTDPPVIVTVPNAPVYTQVGSLLVSPYPFAVTRNEEVTLHIIGRANTEYDINVYYSSGASAAKGLENQYTDSQGHTAWFWKIGGKTNSGEYHIDIIGGGEKTSLPFRVE